MLVLLIIFMVVTPALLAGFNAQPPQGQNLKDHPEDEENDQVLGIDKDGQLLPEQEADLQDGDRGRDQADLRRSRDGRQDHVPQGRQGSGVRQGRRCDRHGGQERRLAWSRLISDQKPGTMSHGGGRYPCRSRPAAPAGGDTLMAMSGWWRRRADERDQRHAHDRRAARAADHLHGGDPDACGSRSTCSFPIRIRRSLRRTRIRTRSCSRCNADGSYSINTEKVNEDRLGPRLKEIYDAAPEKIIFVKGDPKVKYGQVVHAMDVSRGLRREGHRRAAQGHAGRG